MTKLYSTWLCLFVCKSFIKINFREVGGRSCKYLSYQRIQEKFLPLGLASLFPGNISKPMYFCRIMGAFQLYGFHHCSLWESNVVPRLLSIYEKRNLRTRLTCLLSFQTQHEENFYLFLMNNVFIFSAAGRVVLLFSSVWKPDETRSTSFCNYFSNKKN